MRCQPRCCCENATCDGDRVAFDSGARGDVQARTRWVSQHDHPSLQGTQRRLDVPAVPTRAERLDDSALNR